MQSEKLNQIKKEIQNHLNGDKYKVIINNEGNILIKHKKYSRIVISINLSIDVFEYVTFHVNLLNQVGYYKFNVSIAEMEINNKQYLKLIDNFLIDLNMEIVKFIEFSNNLIKEFDDNNKENYSCIIDLNDINLFINNKSSNQIVGIHASLEFDEFYDKPIRCIGYINSKNIPYPIKVFMTSNTKDTIEVLKFLL